MKLELLLIALGTLASEDLACVAAGVLVAKGELSFAAATAACVIGIFGGDLLLFLAGRWFGWRALKKPWVARYLPAEKVQLGLDWIAARGLRVVLLSRFAPGLRLPTYFAAGLVGASSMKFASYFLLAALLWTPLLVGGSWLLGEGVMRSALEGSKSVAAAIALAATAVAAMRAVIRLRGKWIAFLRKAVQWEFWPAWLAYLPVVPYLLYLAARHRSLTLFTASNPGILTGGLVGESKAEILANLDSGSAARHMLIPADWPISGKLDAAMTFARQFPLVLKPDVGERGEGVTIARSIAQVEGYLRAAPGAVIVQDYVPGAEFGIFYCRQPGDASGRVTSITAKEFPALTGDGTRTLRDLIQADKRASTIAGVYERLCRYPLDSVPAKGERVQLVEVGSHCRGAIFLDASSRITPALEAAVDRISQSHPGFYFGRFDVRSPSVEALERGEFTVIELNGVGAEPAHIYDPAVSLLDAYRTLFSHWRTAFAIGAANRDKGAKPSSIRTLLRILRGR